MPLIRFSAGLAAALPAQVIGLAGQPAGKRAGRTVAERFPARAFGSLLIIDASPAAVYLGKTLFLRQPAQEKKKGGGLPAHNARNPRMLPSVDFMLTGQPELWLNSSFTL